MRWKTVVLPAPFGPMSPTISPGATREVEPVDGLQPAEALGEPADLEHPRSRRGAPTGRRLRSQPMSPFGRNEITRIRISP